MIPVYTLKHYLNDDYLNNHFVLFDTKIKIMKFKIKEPKEIIDFS